MGWIRDEFSNSCRFEVQLDSACSYAKRANKRRQTLPSCGFRLYFGRATSSTRMTASQFGQLCSLWAMKWQCFMILHRKRLNYDWPSTMKFQKDTTWESFSICVAVFVLQVYLINRSLFMLSIKQAVNCMWFSDIFPLFIYFHSTWILVIVLPNRSSKTLLYSMYSRK